LTPPKSPGSERYAKQMRGHRLRREITATVVANQLVDRAGTTFVFRLAEETGAPVSQLARAFAVAREVFDMRSLWSAVQALDNLVQAGTQLSMLLEARRLLERASRWLVRANAHPIDIARFTRRYQPGAQLLAGALPDVLSGADRAVFGERLDELEAAAVPRALAVRVASMQALLSVFDIVEDATASGRDQQAVTAVYFTIGSRLELDWLRDRILELPRADRWQALARAALRDDLYGLHRSLTHEVLRTGGPQAAGEQAIDLWWHRNAGGIERCLGMIADIKASHSYDTTTLPVALREVRNLLFGATARPIVGARGAS
jgi:glutamate dehydrogenase